MTPKWSDGTPLLLVGGILTVSVLSALPAYFYWTDNTALMVWGLKWLFLPTLLFSGWLLLQPWAKNAMPWWQRVLTIPCLAGLLVAMLSGPMLMLNAWLPDQGEMLIEGIIQSDHTAPGRSKGKVILIDKRGVTHKWPVHSSAYAQMKQGSWLRIRATQGGLGILFVRPEDLYWELHPTQRNGIHHDPTKP